MDSHKTTTIPEISPKEGILIWREHRFSWKINHYFYRHNSSEALEYSQSIKLQFGSNQRIEKLGGEFPLFLNGNEDYEKLPMKEQLYPVYEDYRKNHKALFSGFDDFLKAAGLI